MVLAGRRKGATSNVQTNTDNVHRLSAEGSGRIQGSLMSETVSYRQLYWSIFCAHVVFRRLHPLFISFRLRRLKAFSVTNRVPNPVLFSPDSFTSRRAQIRRYRQ